MLLLVLARLLPAQGPSAAQHLNRGAAHLRKNEHSQAILELKKAVALDPKSAAAHQLLGQAYLASSAIELIAEAKAEFQQALDLDPNLLWAHFYLAKIYFDLGRYEKARAQLERGLQTRPNVPHLLSLLGEVHRHIGDPMRSLELNRQALAADPSMTPAHYYLALALLDLKRQEEAVRELQRAVQSKYVIPEMYITLGSIYVQQSRLDDAAALYRKAVALDPSRPEGHLKLAELYRLQGKHDQALAQLKLSAPDSKRTLSTEYFQRLQADYHYQMARVYDDQKRTEDAIGAYRKVLEVQPDHQPSRERLAELTRAP